MFHVQSLQSSFEMSALKLFTMAIDMINSDDKTKLPFYNSCEGVEYKFNRYLVFSGWSFSSTLHS